MSDRGCLAISRNETVTDINLSGCVKLSDSAISTLARQCPLVALRLANGLRAVTPFAVRAIAEVRGATLTLLDLSGNDHLDVDECLTALSHRCPVLTLHLFIDRLTERGGKLIREGTLPTLQILELGEPNNQILTGTRPHRKKSILIMACSSHTAHLPLLLHTVSARLLLLSYHKLT